MTTSGFFAYHKAVDTKAEQMPKKEEMQTKLEEVCKVEKAQVLKILLESRKQLDILIDGVTLSPSADSD